MLVRSVKRGSSQWRSGGYVCLHCRLQARRQSQTAESVSWEDNFNDLSASTREVGGRTGSEKRYRESETNAKTEAKTEEHPSTLSPRKGGRNRRRSTPDFKIKAGAGMSSQEATKSTLLKAHLNTRLGPGAADFVAKETQSKKPRPLVKGLSLFNNRSHNRERINAAKVSDLEEQARKAPPASMDTSRALEDIVASLKKTDFLKLSRKAISGPPIQTVSSRKVRRVVSWPSVANQGPFEWSGETEVADPITDAQRKEDRAKSQSYDRFERAKSAPAPPAPEETSFATTQGTRHILPISHNSNDSKLSISPHKLQQPTNSSPQDIKHVIRSEGVSLTDRVRVMKSRPKLGMEAIPETKSPGVASFVSFRQADLMLAKPVVSSAFQPRPFGLSIKPVIRSEGVRLTDRERVLKSRPNLGMEAILETKSPGVASFVSFRPVDVMVAKPVVSSAVQPRPFGLSITAAPEGFADSPADLAEAMYQSQSSEPQPQPVPTKASKAHGSTSGSLWSSFGDKISKLRKTLGFKLSSSTPAADEKASSTAAPEQGDKASSVYAAQESEFGQEQTPMQVPREASQELPSNVDSNDAVKLSPAAEKLRTKLSGAAAQRTIAALDGEKSRPFGLFVSARGPEPANGQDSEKDATVIIEDATQEPIRNSRPRNMARRKARYLEKASCEPAAESGQVPATTFSLESGSDSMGYLSLEDALSRRLRAAKATSESQQIEQSNETGATETTEETPVIEAEVEAADLEVDRQTSAGTLDAKDLEVTALDIKQPPVPGLSYGLDRVLFNSGVYQLQDPHSRVYSFDPYLQKIMPVVEFDFNALKEYKTSSQDKMLVSLAQTHGKKYIGSTSSMTSTLGHFHYLLSQWRALDTSSLSGGFASSAQEGSRALVKSFTLINRAPNAIFLRWKDGTYAIDADKEYDSPNVLMMLGKSMEKLLTMPKSDFERYRKSDPRQVPVEERTSPEAFQYTTLGDILMRSQLDAHDPRLPGTGMFDLKTRAVVSVRMDFENFEDMSGYQIRGLRGKYESYEREYYDMMRSTLLKYMLQARMGRMDGIFVAYHNVERIFGFQYLPLSEIDKVIHSQSDTCLGDQEFKVSLHLLNEALEMATKKFPEQSLRFHFETREKPLPALHIFAEPIADEEIDTIQDSQKDRIAEFERDMMGIGDDALKATCLPNNRDAADQTAEESAAADGTNAVDSMMKAKPKKAGEHGSSETPADRPFIRAIDPQNPDAPENNFKPLLYMCLITRSRVNGEYVDKPENLRPQDNWSIEYSLEAKPTSAAVWAAYVATRERRRKPFEKYEKDDADDEGEGVQKKDNAYVSLLRDMAQRGREWRGVMDKEEEGRDVVVCGQPVRRQDERIEGVDDYVDWLYRSKA